MKNISGQYQDLLEGKMTQAQFLRNARMMFPSFVTQHNSFNDSVAILKQKGMLNEGDAVKGTPDKEPTYESPTPDDKIKYKKVEQSPEVDEQDGIYPATTITDIPKEKTYKKVKNTSDGLEPIKDNDTKNEMKKVKVVKEGYSAVLDLPNGYYFAIDDDWEDEYQGKNGMFFTISGNNIYDKDGGSIQSSPREFLSQFTPEEILRVKDVKEGIHDKDITSASHTNVKTPPKGQGDYDPKARAASLARLKNMGPKKDVKETQLNERSFDDIFADFVETDDSTEIKSYLKAKGKEAIEKIKAKLPQLKDKAKEALTKLVKEELDEARFKKGTDIGKPGKGFEKIAKAASKEYGSEEAGKRVAGAILNKVLNKESVLEQLVTKIMNETLAKKSAK